jgi:hypothetical protein
MAIEIFINIVFPTLFQLNNNFDITFSSYDHLRLYSHPKKSDQTIHYHFPHSSCKTATASSTLPKTSILFRPHQHPGTPAPGSPKQKQKQKQKPTPTNPPSSSSRRAGCGSARVQTLTEKRPVSAENCLFQFAGCEQTSSCQHQQPGTHAPDSPMQIPPRNLPALLMQIRPEV